MARAKATMPAPMPVEDPAAYTVVARRYRPQRFEDVVGQDHVVEALRNAIRLNKLAHAYLFSGTRGVGKTSLARIFAKCLNCVQGPTDRPDLTCDICQAIAVGQDVDVIEIDGASNNGVDAVRELRQNAGLRPSRARFKIYYIDEVHMLSTGAFNALLKTLEEPPPHVKFLFATTEPNKIPITVLSRCQRYDFAGISPEQIVDSLSAICKRENVEAESEALRLIARRAGGSMRDAQSLLEQLLASSGECLSVELVHKLLGTASDERILDLIDALSERDQASVLRQVEQAAGGGVQPVDLLNGCIEFLRDVMVVAAGADDAILTATPRQRPRLKAVVERWSIDAIVAALQILAEARGRLRGSPFGRLIVELAFVKVCRLEDLTEVAELIGRLNALEAGQPAAAAAAPAAKKKSLAPEPDRDRERNREPGADAGRVSDSSDERAGEETRATQHASDASLPPLELRDVERVWNTLIKQVGIKIGMALTNVAPTAVEPPHVLVVGLAPTLNWVADECDNTEVREKIELTMQKILRRPIKIRFDRASDDGNAPVAVPQGPTNHRERLEADPMVRKVVELFDARAVHMDTHDLP